MVQTRIGPEPALLDPLTVPSAYEHVLERVRRAVALGVLLPGDLLPSERELAGALGVSRITVREALRVLQSCGAVVTRRGRGGGSVIAAEASRFVLSAAAGDPARTLRDVSELRLALEPTAALLAATRATAADLDRLAGFHHDLALSHDVDTFRRADNGFHLAVAAASGNRMLRDAVEDARAAMFGLLDPHGFAIVHDTSRRAHHKILQAIRRGSPTTAERQMRQHVIQASAEVADALGPYGADRGL